MAFLKRRRRRRRKKKKETMRKLIECCRALRFSICNHPN